MVLGFMTELLCVIVGAVIPGYQSFAALTVANRSSTEMVHAIRRRDKTRTRVGSHFTVLSSDLVI